MLIRTEIGIDAPMIDTLLQSCFPGDDEARLVHELRENGLLALSVVACDDNGRILGYVAFSAVTVAGNEYSWVGLAPIAVAKSARRQGISHQLIAEGITILAELGYQAVVVLGDPAYYQQFGFTPAHQHHLTCRWPGAETIFQVCALTENALNGVTGQVAFSCYFDRFD